MPTVALVVQQGFGARVLLQTEVLDTLLDAGVKVVVLASDAPTLTRYLQGRGLSQVAVEQLDVNRCRNLRRATLRALLRRMRLFAVPAKTIDDMFEMEWRDALGRRSWRGLSFLSFIWLVSRIMRSNELILKSVVGLENRLDAPHLHDAFFEKYRPDVVVFTSTGTFDYDHFVIREAKRYGARVVSYILSWDNTSVRGLGVNLSDHIIVWSDVMKDELVNLHRLPAEIISVDGVPHYDFYVNGKLESINKDKLAKLFGFDPNKRLLFFGTKSPNTYLYNAEIAQIICHAICEGCLPRDCHLLARLHPIYLRQRDGKYLFQDQLQEWDELLERYGGICLSVDRPIMLEGDLSLFMPDSEIAKLVALLKHSEVIINMFSTLNLEASIVDRPALNVAFDFSGKQPPSSKIARFNIRYDEVQNHNQRIIKSNGTSVAHSAEEMIEQIRQYLSNPNLHSAGRRQIVATECGNNLGQAGRAVGRRILQCVGEGV